ncbi:putative transferase, protein kinase RLK-Pelle-LRR-Xa family [Helianthus annuus]|nr:putative transferase, protein kinase RLK-Pelle-LRR-Xa family [Helianthus annuus]
MNLRLSDMGLRGPFPLGVKNCTSLTELDLSSNHLTGQLPSNVSDFMQFLTKLDLSSNNLSGQIPLELAGLDRIKEFDVANNRLSGQVPIFRSSSISADSYAGNLGLCGPPLDPCVWRAEKDLFLAGFAVGFPFFTIVTLLMVYCSTRLSMSNMRSFLLMVKKIKGRKQDLISQSPDILLTEQNNTEESKVTSMEKYIRRLSLVELKLATNNFDTKSEIGYGNMGIMYKAVFPNSMMLAVKRLHKFESFEKEFLLEIQILGRLRHTNLVPLLCFCFEMEKKFLVYKYMSNGTLHQWLHSRPQVEGRKMGWTLRLRIAVGIARGLAWLHHNNALQVAHLKIDSKCILLDDMFEPKISNFGNSIILMTTSGTLSRGCTLVVQHSVPSPYKDDVYSFGILLLELVSGKERPSIETESLGDDVCSEEFNTIDECLVGQGFDEEIYETLGIAKKCIQTHKNGAASMLEVYQLIRVVGISRNEISVDLYMDLEGNTNDI